MLGLKLNLNMISQLAMAAATGGTSMIAQMAVKMAMQQMASMVLQQVGQQLGLPPAMISAAQAAFGQASGVGGNGDFSLNGFSSRSMDAMLRSAGFSATERGSIIRDMQKQVQDQVKSEMKDSIQDFINNMNRDSANKKLNSDIKAVMNGKGSILMKLAIALGQIADQKMNDMAKKAEQIGNMGKIEAGNQSKFSQMNAELSALGQEFGIISQAMNNVLKSIGEGASTLARKS
jgi:hypothetical protein